MDVLDKRNGEEAQATSQESGVGSPIEPRLSLNQYTTLGQDRMRVEDGRQKEGGYVWSSSVGRPGLWKKKDSRSGRRKNRLVDSSLTLLEFGRRNGGTPSSGTCLETG